MAASVGSNNIYPPIVSPYAPNFVLGSDKGCRIYFSLSAYNSIRDYADIHITVTRQSDNVTALNKRDYPSQIIIKPASEIQKDDDRKSTDKYYITISNNDIEGGWQVGIVYKVQMRFSSDASGRYTPPLAVDDYLSSHLSAFSEWSQVSLVQCINQPEVQIKDGRGGNLTTFDSNMFNSDTLEIVGTVITDDTDPVQRYTLNLYDGQDNLIETSGTLFPAYQSSEDQINYVFKRALEDGASYRLEVNYITYGLYEETISYPLLILLNLIEQLDAYVTVEEDTENGRMGIHIASHSIAPFAGKITIRRTSSLSNFQLWEDVHTIELRSDRLDYLWYDYTIESGIWYKYCIQKRDVAGNRGVITRYDDPVMIIFDHMFLNAEGKQIKIKFNPQISSFQRTVNDAKIDTLGDKYPYIRRNGATDYKQFPINGLISFMMDGDKVFTSREETYSEDVLDLYKEYNDDNRIGLFNDITYERHFREQVMDFLYKHNVKLFRSATEGNILVKLMNITFQPNQQLGRMIYSFSCTAYEVAEPTLTNIDYYKIQEIEDPGNTGQLSYELNYIGQWSDTIPAGEELVHSDPTNGVYSILEQYYKKYERTNYILSIDHLSYLRIEMEDKPYLIYEDENGTIRPWENIDNIATMAMPQDNGFLYLGYIAYINGKTIVIPKDGIYELKGKDVSINSIKFAKDTNMNFQYHAVLEQAEDVSKILSLTSFTTIVGQEWGAYRPGDSLYNKLSSKYYMEHPGDYYQVLASIDGIRVEANPGTVVYVREDGENYADRHVIGPTESLDFYDPDEMIADAYFTGMHFDEANDYEVERDILPEGKFHLTDIVVNNLNEIENPKERYVYQLEANTNKYSTIALNAAMAAAAPEPVILVTTLGVPTYFIKKDDIKGEKNIMIIAKRDINHLKDYLEEYNYDIYTIEEFNFTQDQQIKIATKIDNSGTIEIVMNNTDNRNKISAYEKLLEQFPKNKTLTAAIKRQLWNDVVYTISGFYIYHNYRWEVFDLETQDAVCPVPVMIDYVCEVLKGYYRTSQL